MTSNKTFCPTMLAIFWMLFPLSIVFGQTPVEALSKSLSLESSANNCNLGKEGETILFYFGDSVQHAAPSTSPAVATVNDAGLVTAVAVGTTQISATSVAFPTVSGSAPLTVTVHPGFTSWAPSRVGVIGNQFTDGVSGGAVGLSDGSSLVRWREVFEGSLPYKSWNVLVGNGTTTDVGTGLPGTVNMSSADGSTAFGEGDDKVYRFNGTSWQELTSQPPGVILGVVALSSNSAVLLTRQNNGSVYRWDGNSWTLHSNLPGQTNFGTLRAFGEDNIAVISSGGSPCTLRVWNGTTWTPVPWPQGVSVAICGSHSGTAN